MWIALTLILQASAPMPSVAVVGVQHEQLAPSLRGGFTERLMRGLLREHLSVLGPGDILRRGGEEARQEMLACAEAERCDESLLAGAQVDAIIVLVGTGPFEFSIRTFLSDGRRLESIEVKSPLVLLGDRLEQAGPALSQNLHRALGRRYSARPPWTYYGDGAMAGGLTLTLGSAALLFDSVRRYRQLTGELDEELPPLEAFQSAELGRAELILGITSAALAAASFYLAVELYARDRPRVPPEALQLSWTVTPAGLGVAIAW